MIVYDCQNLIVLRVNVMWMFVCALGEIFHWFIFSTSVTIREHKYQEAQLSIRKNWYFQKCTKADNICTVYTSIMITDYDVRMMMSKKLMTWLWSKGKVYWGLHWLRICRVCLYVMQVIVCWVYCYVRFRMCIVRILIDTRTVHVCTVLYIQMYRHVKLQKIVPSVRKNRGERICVEL